MNHICTDTLSERHGEDKRWSDRRVVEVPARLMWKDQRGTPRFASVIVRDVSEFGAYVESRSPLCLPLFRLVHLQLERAANRSEWLPDSLQQGGRMLSAVYRVSPPSPGSPHGFGLRMMVDPRRAAAGAGPNRATA